MFNAEKLLGGLIRSSTRGSRGAGLGSLITGGVAMGALGVAMEAVDHYMNKPKAASAPPQAPGMPGRTPGSTPGAVPPPPPASAGTGTGTPPPPPPIPGAPTAPPPASPSQAVPHVSGGNASSDAVLLIRAMIAAANADGVIDQEERNQIVQRLQTIELSSEEHAFIVQELLSPADLSTIVAGVTSEALARQVYTVSLMAIEVDTPQEAQYMATLADRLGIDPATVDEIKRSLSLE